MTTGPAEAQLSVYPNPAQDVLHISASLPEIIQETCKIYVRNVLGEVILYRETAVNGNSITMDLQLPASFTQGVYFITVQAGNFVQHKEFLVQQR